MNRDDVRIDTDANGPCMKTAFFDAHGRLRNGWWMLVFIACIAATRPVHMLASRALEQAGVADVWIEPVSFLLVLLATWVCTRLRREPLSSVGFVLDARWLRQFGVGVLLGSGSLLLAAALIWMVGGVRFELDPAREVSMVVQGLYVFLFVSLFEETLFRGFLFQRLADGAGVWVAQIAFALLFALGHGDNPGMEGMTRVIASVELALAAILLGVAYLRTRSLALPVGIHLGWNWMQGSVMGMGVSGLDQSGWWQPVLLDQPQWLSGGQFGAEASVFGVVTDLVLIALLWRWKGTADRAADTRAVTTLRPALQSGLD